MICNQKSRNFGKIWGVTLKNVQNLLKTLQLKISQNGPKNDLLPKKSKYLKILFKIWGVGHRKFPKFPKSEKNFYARNIIEWAEK